MVIFHSLWYDREKEVTAMVDYSNILKAIRKFVCDQMACNDAAHDTDHILRVVALAQKICRAYPEADPWRTELLAWLHDMNDDKLASNVGEAALSSFLRSVSVPEADICFVMEALPYISYRKHPKLSEDIPMEIRIVQDADRIDAIGAVGIARTFAYGGAKNRGIEDGLKHFDEKLLLLYDFLSTEEARRIALPRHEFLKAFYNQYRMETQL